MTFNVFFSWQSDRGESSQEFVERALATALERIVSDATIEPAVRAEGLTVDRDTKGIGGSPPIVDTIFSKIEGAAIFVPDLTFVSIRVGGNPAPNPNVLIEYGWALSVLGHARIIPVMNTHYGAPTSESMPFDMRHLRFPVCFHLPPEADAAASEVALENLSRKLEEQLRLIIEQSDFLLLYQSDQPFPMRNAALQFRVAGPMGKTYGDFIEPQRDVRLKNEAALWLNLHPIGDSRRRWSTTDLKRLITIPAVQLLPLAAFGSNVHLGTLRGEHGFGVYVPIAGGEPTPSVVYVFETGEIWGIDTFHALINGTIHLSAENLTNALNQYRAFMRDGLKISTPYICNIGIDRIKNASLVVSGRREGPAGSCVTNDVTQQAVIESNSDSGAVVREFIEKVIEKCGVE